MNKFCYYFLAIALSASALLLSTCKEDDKLSVTPEWLEFAADDTGEMLVKVTSNIKWKYSKSADWIHISEKDDGIAVTVDKYTATTSERSGIINVSAGKAAPVTVNVTQLPAVKNTLSVSPASISFAANETGAKTATITTNASDWNAVAISAPWLTLEKQGNTLNVTASANTATQRTASINVTAGNADPVTIAVSQAGPDDPITDPGGNSLNATPSQMDFLSVAGSKTLQVTANVAWVITSNQSWCTVSTPSGSGNASVTVTVTANTGLASRIARLTVTNSEFSLTKTITVTQQGEEPYLIIAPDSKNIGAGAETITITVSANVEFDVTPNAAWITVTQQTATAVTLQAQANTANTSRSGTVTFKQKDGNETATLTVTQAKAPDESIAITPASKNIGAGAETINVAVTANVEFDVTPNVAWMSVTQATTTAVTLQAQANTATASRTGTVTFRQKGGNAEATLTVNQAGKVEVLPENIIFVSPLGNDANDGKSWDKAMKSITTAIHIAPVSGQVWVEEGTYQETVVMKNGMNVYGGFNRTESSIAERGTRKSTILGKSISMANNFTTPTIIDGFKITGNTEDFLLVSKNGIMTNCEISGNGGETQGSVRSGSVDGGTVSNCTISSRIEVKNGGKVINSYISAASNAYMGNGRVWLVNGGRIEGCILSYRNNSNYSGYVGIWCRGYNNYIVNCTFDLFNAVGGASNVLHCIVYYDYFFGGPGNVYIANCLILPHTLNHGLFNAGNSSVVGYTINNLLGLPNQTLYFLNDDYSPRSNSPAVNAGDNSFVTVDKDILGNPRIQNGKVDIGAIESSF